MPQFRLFRGKSGRFFIEDATTKKQASLRTRDADEARRLLAAKNEAQSQPLICLQMARAYLTAADPMMVQRTWQTVMDTMGQAKRGPTGKRWITACKDRAFDLIRRVKLTETRAEQFWTVLNAGTVSTNTFLRRMHNFALDMNWILAPVILRRQWPKIQFKEKRAITLEEHLRIIEREHNPERKMFYELAWHLGASQSDLAHLHAEDIDWPSRTITFERMKLRHRAVAPPQIRFGKEAEAIFAQLPGTMSRMGMTVVAWVVTTLALQAEGSYIPVEPISGSIAPYVDKDGYVNPIVNLGDIDFGRGLTLPLALNFSSALRSPSPEFGQGWECPLFDAKVFDTQQGVKRMETLGGKDRYIVYDQRTDTWHHYFTDFWTGKVDGDYFNLTYKDGVKFSFYKGLINSVELPDGRKILWNRLNGKLVSMQLSGQPPAMEITYDNLGFAQQIVLHSPNAKAAKALSLYKLTPSLVNAGLEKIECPRNRVVWFEQSHDQQSHNPVLKWSDTSYPAMTLSWSSATGKILSDNHYTYTMKEINKDNTWPEMVRADKATGKLQSYYFNQANGDTDEAFPNGSSRHVEMIQAPGPSYKMVRLIQDTKGGQTQTVLRRAFDDKGHLVMESFGLANGKEVTRQFVYDDAGRVVSFLLNGKEQWKNIYDPATGQLIERDIANLGVKLAFASGADGAVKESIINSKGAVTSTKTLSQAAWKSTLVSMQRD